MQRRVAAVMQEEAEYDQGEEASLPHPTAIDGHAPAEISKRLGRRVVTRVVSREMRGMRLGVATDSSGAARRHADAGICKKTPLAAWERGTAAQATLAFSRSPPNSPARAF